MIWYSFWNWLEALWEAKRLNILLSIGVIIFVFMAVFIIARIARHKKEL